MTTEQSTTPIPRYEPTSDPDVMIASKTGDYVLFEDYERTLAALEWCKAALRPFAAVFRGPHAVEITEHEYRQASAALAAAEKEGA